MLFGALSCCCVFTQQNARAKPTRNCGYAQLQLPDPGSKHSFLAFNTENLRLAALASSIRSMVQLLSQLSFFFLFESEEESLIVRCYRSDCETKLQGQEHSSVVAKLVGGRSLLGPGPGLDPLTSLQIF